VLVSFNVVVNQQQLLDTQKNVSKLISQFNGLARIAQFALAAIGVGKLTAAADEYINIENKLKAVTESTEEFVTAQRGVERIADDLMQPVSDITDAYLRYSLATESLGESQENVLDFTKRVTQAMILSGATAEEAHRAAVQLAQGFGKNFKAAAQDLKSVKEQAPVLARIIEKAAGAMPGQLLVAAKAGKITSRLVFDSVREAGEELDRDFTKRQKRFEDVSNLLGNQWMQLVKRLKPAFVPIINFLESIVHWIGEWVKDGSALNSVIAGAIVVLGTLTYVFGGLAAAAAAAAAPFVGIFLALEDLVAFIRGDESLIEEWLDKAFGPKATEKARVALQELVVLAGKVMAAFGSEAEFEMAAWRLERAVTKALKSAWDAFIEYAYNSDNPISSLVRWSTAKSGTKSEDKSVFQMTPGEFFGGAAGRGDEYRKRYAAEHPGEAIPELGPTPTIPTVPSNWEPPPNLAGPSSYVSPYGGSNMSPVINNNITVNGNADGNVSRDIATRQGAATSQALGRDRSAVGAAFGAGQ
jgi:tape measure domain-containing protein